MLEIYRDGVCEDYVQIFSDDSQTQPLTERLCGNQITNLLTSNNNFVVIVNTVQGRQDATFTLYYETLARDEKAFDVVEGGEDGVVEKSGGDKQQSTSLWLMALIVIMM